LTADLSHPPKYKKAALQDNMAVKMDVLLEMMQAMQNFCQDRLSADRLTNQSAQPMEEEEEEDVEDLHHESASTQRFDGGLPEAKRSQSSSLDEQKLENLKAETLKDLKGLLEDYVPGRGPWKSRSLL
jgi:hypothetical protein